VLDAGGQVVPLYKESHALLISVSRYKGIGQKGWRPLEETRGELDQVATVLRRHGFQVRRIQDPGGHDLVTVLRHFVAEYGRAPDNRLLLFFSGHGYTDKQTGLGYLVPVDAPDPHINPTGFFEQALPIRALQLLAEEISARHVLFVFDSCFSGSIFMTKGAEVVPQVKALSQRDRRDFFLGPGRREVRQFISAGGPDEELPAKSVFVPLFIEALNGQAAGTADGYVTGKEIGLWLEQNLPRYNRLQSPHSDVIRDPRLAFGDIVFQAPARAGRSEENAASAPNPTTAQTIPAPTAHTEVRTHRAEEVIAHRAFRDCADCPEMIVIPSGRFTMGTPLPQEFQFRQYGDGRDSERPEHEVLVRRFALSKTPITRGQFAVFAKEANYLTGGGCFRFSGFEDKQRDSLNWRNPGFVQDNRHPAVCISWNDAKAYTQWLSKKTGKAYRLPTEAEWEYAARAGTATTRYWGDNPDLACGYGNVSDLTTKRQIKGYPYAAHNCKDGYVYTAPVGMFKPNRFGLYDMVGNAYQWVEDCYLDSYKNAPSEGSWTQNDCHLEKRAVRGSSWHAIPPQTRSADRYGDFPGTRSFDVGFRVATTTEANAPPPQSPDRL
jgi:formylglycine-generating enzyme required for sulfatase activity